MALKNDELETMIKKQQAEIDQLRKEFDAVLLKMRKMGLLEQVVNNTTNGGFHVV